MDWFISIESLTIGTFFAAYRQSEWFGKLVVWILVIGSVMAWTVMLSKRIELKSMAQQTRRFLDAYRRGRDPLALARRAGQYAPSPLEVIYQAAVRELCGDTRAGTVLPDPLDPGTVSAGDVESARGGGERMLAEQMLKIESGMSTLATATTAAPFLGLLGTVWGVMSAFQGMAGQGVVLLGNVAPGISGALTTTVVGLFVALPSAIGYNYLSDRVRALQVEMENFVEEFVASVNRQYRQGRGGEDT